MVLEYPQGGDSTPCLDNLFSARSPHRNKFFLVSRWNFPGISSCPFLLCHCWAPPAEPGPSSAPSLQPLTDTGEVPSRCPLWRLNSPSSLSLSCSQRCSIPSAPPQENYFPGAPCPSYPEEPRPVPLIPTLWNLSLSQFPIHPTAHSSKAHPSSWMLCGSPGSHSASSEGPRDPSSDPPGLRLGGVSRAGPARGEQRGHGGDPGAPRGARAKDGAGGGGAAGSNPPGPAAPHGLRGVSGGLGAALSHMPALPQVPVRFEEVALRFSRQEWDTLDEGQRELYRSVMEDCALSKPHLLLWLEREELSTMTESEPEAADVSPEPAVELARPSCSRGDGMLGAKTTEPGEGSCREPEESRNLVEESGNFIEESGNLAEEGGKPSEESGKPAEEGGSPAVPENCSTPPIPLEAAVPGDLSQPSPAPSHPLSACCREAVDQNQSPSPPTAAADTEVGIPMEVPQEEVTVEKLIVPGTSSEGPEEEKGLEQEDVKDSGNVGQGPAADVPKGPGKVDSGPEKPEKGSCVGRPAGCQRNATRELYSCPICSKRFLLKINFLIHQRSHSNSVPYVCVHCNRKFMSKKKIRRHLRAWAASGTCQPSEPEPCPSQTPCPTSQPQTQVASGTCQPPDAQVCPSQTPCLTSQPQTQVASGTCQPPDAQVCPRQVKCLTSQPQALVPNGTCQPSEPGVCPSQVLCPTSQPQMCVASGTCQGSKPEECPSWTPCPTSQPQTWAANGTCHASTPEARPNQVLCPTSQPQTWAANGLCQPSELEVCPNQTPCPSSQPQAWVANGTFQASKPEACPSHTPWPTSQPQTWAASGICQPPNQPEVCPSQTPCPASQPQALSRDRGTVWEKPSPARCPLSPGKMLYTCSECLENFSSQSFLTVHQRQHSGRHLILCPCCNWSFTCISDFVRQHWAHAGVRPHQCGICQKTFKRFYHLKVHRRTHMRQNRPLPRADPVPIPAGTVPGDGVGSQGVTSKGCCAAAGP
ncbi:oocyte zinc finger protein XlCOF7.1-like isoform X3 [Chiroxiphia lanceolata]|uniref:oocyte zinc finger protein XlCOF7.1-like isoform X3 n=1 Tax=Chiroxiphia lanceolata TaxID=296741 RepID=UPI0013CEAEC5|nr:oocyte zinc finger protein XlCOF7.1-like isoform X3 [Chiroxiphia lanceolata]